MGAVFFIVALPFLLPLVPLLFIYGLITDPAETWEATKELAASFWQQVAIPTWQELVDYFPTFIQGPKAWNLLEIWYWLAGMGY